RDRAGHRRRDLRGGGPVGHNPGVRLQAHRQARVQDGADPPSFRADGLVGAHGGDPLLDHQLRARARRPVDPQAQMIASPVFAGQSYAVLGLARSGIATVDALRASGAEVMAWDEKEEARAAVAGKARIADPLTTSIYGYSGVVVSPGVPITRHPIADRARAANVPLIGDI